MWALIGVTTASSVVLLAAVRRYVTVPLDFMLPKVSGIGGVVADVNDTSYARLGDADEASGDAPGVEMEEPGAGDNGAKTKTRKEWEWDSSDARGA